MPAPAYPSNDKRPAVPGGSIAQVQMYTGQPSSHQTIRESLPSYAIPFNNKRPAVSGGPTPQAQKYAGQPGNRQAIYDDTESEEENTRSDEPQKVGPTAAARGIPVRSNQARPQMNQARPQTVTQSATRIPKLPVPTRTVSVHVNDPVRDHHSRTTEMYAPEPPENPMITRANTIPHPPHVESRRQSPLNHIDEEELPRQAPGPYSSLPSMGFRVPTYEELDRIQIWAKIQGDLANIPKRKGHTYGRLDVYGGARAVRGGVYDAKNPEVAAIFSSSNIYGDGKAHGDKSFIADIDMSSEDFHKFVNGEDLPQFVNGEDLPQFGERPPEQPMRSMAQGTSSENVLDGHDNDEGVTRD